MPDVKMLRAIFGFAKQAGVDNEQLHDIVALQFDKTSLKELTAKECRTLIDGLRGKPQGGGASGHKGTQRGYVMSQAGRRRSGTKVDYFVKDREMRMLREAALLRGWSDETLDAFIAKQLKGEPLRMMSQLNKVLWPLKSMNRRDGLHG